MARRRQQFADDDVASATIEQLHKFAFIQAMMNRHVMPEADAKQMMKRLIPNLNDAAYRSLLSEVNKDLQNVSFEIKTMKFLLDDVTYVGMINTRADEPSKMGSTYKHEEKEYFQRVIETMAAEDGGDQGLARVSSTALLNLDVRRSAATQGGEGTQSTQSSQVGKLTKMQKQGVLRMLAADRWLAVDEEDGSYCIGVRTFMELGAYLLQQDDVPEKSKEAWKAFM